MPCYWWRLRTRCSDVIAIIGHGVSGVVKGKQQMRKRGRACGSVGKGCGAPSELRVAHWECDCPYRLCRQLHRVTRGELEACYGAHWADTWTSVWWTSRCRRRTSGSLVRISGGMVRMERHQWQSAPGCRPCRASNDCAHCERLSSSELVCGR